VLVSDWPAWATEQVQVEAHQDGWHRRGERLCRQLDVELARWLVSPVEHVGSTAVPGLAAKPIIDVQAAVLDLDCADAVANVLAPNGWHAVPVHLDARPWRRLLVHVVDERRAAHLHLLTAAGASNWHSAMRCALTRPWSTTTAS